MLRFLLQENVRHFRSLLAHARDDDERHRLAGLLKEAEEKLADGSQIWRHTCPHLAISPALGNLLEDELEGVVVAHQAGHGSLQLFDPARDTLYLVAQINFARWFLQDFGQVGPDDGSVCALAMRRKEGVFVSDVLADEALRAFSGRSGVRAVQSTPILSRDGALLGMFSTHFLRPRAFDEADRRICADYAARFSNAISAKRPF